MQNRVTHATVLVHSVCKPALEGLRPHFVDGAKTWLVPEVRCWLQATKRTPSTFANLFTY